MSTRPDPLPLAESAPTSDEPAKSSSLRGDVVRLVREKRYEEALSLLYQARAETPDDRQLQASIQQIKQFLVGAYAKRLGGLDKVAAPVPIAAGRSPDAMLVGRYVDGFATFGDISQTCPLGQLRTLQLLVSLYCGPEPTPPPSEAVAPSRLRDASAPARVPPEPASEPPPTRPTGVASPPVRPLPAPAPSATPAPRPVSWAPPPAEPESLADRVFRETFALGTAAYVQRRYTDAVEAFEECVRLRPRDEGAAVMLRRAQRDLRS